MAGRIVVIFGMIIGAWVGGGIARTGKEEEIKAAPWNGIQRRGSSSKTRHTARTPGRQAASRTQC